MYPSLVIEDIAVSSLLHHPSNPRKHSKKQIRQIADSIRTFGFKIPVLIDTDNRLICGHGRVAACQLLGMSVIPAIRATDLDEARIRAYMIADNRLTEISEWDDALLAENFRILSDLDLDFDLEAIGFDYGDIENFLMLNDDSGEESPVPDVGSLTPVASLGDLWFLGEHRIVCGDSLDPATYAMLFSGQSEAAIVFTDPPYNLAAKEIGKVCEASEALQLHPTIKPVVIVEERLLAAVQQRMKTNARR